jgi:hypothetical protein
VKFAFLGSTSRVQYDNHQKSVNIISEIRRNDGCSTTCFQDISKLLVDYFEGIYKEDSGASISKVVRMTSSFPSFVEEEDNVRLLEVVSKDKLQEVMHSF